MAGKSSLLGLKILAIASLRYSTILVIFCTRPFITITLEGISRELDLGFSQNLILNCVYRNTYDCYGLLILNLLNNYLSFDTSSSYSTLKRLKISLESIDVVRMEYVMLIGKTESNDTKS